jgi:hypothetical protein
MTPQIQQECTEREAQRIYRIVLELKQSSKATWPQHPLFQKYYCRAHKFHWDQVGNRCADLHWTLPRQKLGRKHQIIVKHYAGKKGGRQTSW